MNLNPSFDPTKHCWGRVCPYGHDAGNGKSLRFKINRNCVLCTQETIRRKKEERRQNLKPRQKEPLTVTEVEKRFFQEEQVRTRREQMLANFRGYQKGAL